MEVTKSQGLVPKLLNGNVDRKTLSDVTNTLSQSIPEFQSDIPQPSKVEFVEKLLKEKVAMMKLIEEKNKRIELSGAELQKMRIHLQQLKLQNWNLAQSNSQMQAEVNVGRQKLKALQHELACKEAMFKAKRSQEALVTESIQVVHEKNDAEVSNVQTEVKNNTRNHQELQVIKDVESNHEAKSRIIRSRSMSSYTIKKASELESAETNRPCTRRQSARFKSEKQENLFEIKDIKCSDSYKKSKTPPRRSSIGGGRPPRKAVEKVQSYKEIPLKMKLRRNE